MYGKLGRIHSNLIECRNFELKTLNLNSKFEWDFVRIYMNSNLEFVELYLVELHFGPKRRFVDKKGCFESFLSYSVLNSINLKPEG